MADEQMKKLVVVFVCIICVLSGCALRKEIVIPRSKIQETVSKKFPYDRDIGIARFTVQSPEVYFKGKNIGLRAVYFVHLLDKEVRGSLDVNGHVVYKPETGSFYLQDFTVEDVRLNEKDLLEKVKIQKIVDKVISNYLDGFRIYRLDPRDQKQSLARSYIREIFVRNDDLVVVLGY
ncbi:MAG: DUF1439 domain-containing protein [Syntrophorhabdus sp.]|jgi:hypothetical protein|nr:DUF1439 domain-containing protein [Syntrophorhabdus sp.]